MKIKSFALLCVLPLSSAFASLSYEALAKCETPCTPSSPNEQTLAYTLQRARTVAPLKNGSLITIMTDLRDDKGSLLVRNERNVTIEGGQIARNHFRILSTGRFNNDDSRTMESLHHHACEKYFGDKEDAPFSLEQPDASFNFNGTDFPDAFKSVAEKMRRKSIDGTQSR